MAGQRQFNGLLDAKEAAASGALQLVDAFVGWLRAKMQRQKKNEYHHRNAMHR
jgi:hypothetical protein